MVDESIAAVFQPLQYPSFLVCSAKTAHEHARAFPGPCAWSAPAYSAARRSVVVTGPVPLSGRPDHRPAHPDRVLRAFQRGAPFSAWGSFRPRLAQPPVHHHPAQIYDKVRYPMCERLANSMDSAWILAFLAACAWIPSFWVFNSAGAPRLAGGIYVGGSIFVIYSGPLTAERRSVRHA